AAHRRWHLHRAGSGRARSPASLPRAGGARRRHRAGPRAVPRGADRRRVGGRPRVSGAPVGGHDGGVPDPLTHEHLIAWRAVVRGGAVTLLLLAITSVGQAIVDHDVADFQDSGWVY